MKEVVVEGCEFIITVGGAVIGDGEVSIITPASTNTKVILGGMKKGVFAGPMTIAVANYQDAAISLGTGGGVITPSSQHNTVDMLPVVLKGDSGQVVLSGVNPQSGAPVTGYTVTVKISSAGQSYYKAD